MKHTIFFALLCVVFMSLGFVGVLSVDASQQGYYFTESIRYGTTNSEDVRALQGYLIRQGYLPGGTPNGSVYQTTANAIMQFQRDHNLDADGVIGPMTRRVLNGLAHNATSWHASVSDPISTTTAIDVEAYAKTLWPAVDCIPGVDEACSGATYGHAEILPDYFFIWKTESYADDSVGADLVSAIVRCSNGLDCQVVQPVDTMYRCNRYNSSPHYVPNICP